jgi:hypothetical protein
MRTAVVRFAAFAKAEFHSLPLVAADRAIAPDKLEPYGAYIALTIVCHNGFRCDVILKRDKQQICGQLNALKNNEICRREHRRPERQDRRFTGRG